MSKGARILLALTLTAASGMAQTTVTTSGTTSVNTVPMFGPSSNTTVTNSPIVVSGSNVGIGTASPSTTIDVSGAGSGTLGAIRAISGSNFTALDPNFGLMLSRSASYINNNMVGGSIQFRLANAAAYDTTVMTLLPSGRVGIGTTSPQAPLNVVGNIRADSGQMRFYTSSSDTGGSTGIVANPNGWTRIDPNGSRFLIPVPASLVASASNILDIERTDTWQHLMELHSDGGAFYLGNVGIGTASPASLLSVGSSSQFQVNSAGGVTSGQIVSSGPVGIGVNPQYTLDVAGQIHASQAIYASGGITFSDGSSLTSANTLCGGDYAESVDVSGERATFEPGDVLEIDGVHPGQVEKAATPYSKRVSGIFSTKPGAVGRRQLTPKSDSEVPMAMIGIVPTKASAENGPIEAGDLLVSSSTPGYAMKGTDPNRMLGAIIGKAMASLSSGKGVLEVLVTLQ